MNERFASGEMYLEGLRPAGDGIQCCREIFLQYRFPFPARTAIIETMLAGAVALIGENEADILGCEHHGVSFYQAS